MVNKVFSKRRIQEITASNARRIAMASMRPSLRAFFCWASGNFEAMMDIKMTLSKPNTTSNAINVNRAMIVSILFYYDECSLSKLATTTKRSSIR